MTADIHRYTCTQQQQQRRKTLHCSSKQQDALNSYTLPLFVYLPVTIRVAKHRIDDRTWAADEAALHV